MGYSNDVFRIFLFLSLMLAPPAVQAVDKPAPDLSKVVALINQSLAHACPVSANLALTARHVALDEHPFRDARPAAYRGSNAEWTGYLNIYAASDYEDAGLLKPETPFPSWYPIAKEAPVPGDQLWWVGFDWRKPSVAFAERVFTAKVTRVVAGTIIMESSTPGGSSGSCVLNAKGEVVGVVSFGRELDNGQEVAGFVGTWAAWFRVPEDPKPTEPSDQSGS